MKNNTTELVFILDKSGSMCGMEADTVGGFNSTIAKQRRFDGKVYVSTVLFSNESKVLHDRVDIREIAPMREEDFLVGGCTALLDAIGGAIHHIGNVHKYARREDVPEHTIFVIITDGMENCSHRYSATRVREMIERQTEKYGREFLFLAANIDAVSTAESIGIRRERASNYRQSSEGPMHCYDAIERFCAQVRTEDVIGDDWRGELENA
ncbi:MAG: VWA domain-containing protein [Clostridia bacterium]|nr:VWA domain-containing protein [Clostridia bacterium]